MTIFILVALLALTLWAGRSWRRGLEAVLVLVVLEGAVRKWLVPGASSYVYFAKDLMLLAVYFGYLRDHRARRIAIAVPPALAAAIGFASAVALLMALNPRLPSPLIGILGFKAYVFYAPLLWIVPVAFRGEVELAHWIRRYSKLAIPVGLLATAQFFSPPESRINTYARTSASATSEDAAVISFGSVQRVRVTGTFSFITGYGSYLQAVSLLVLTALTVRRWKIRGSVVLFTTFVLMILGMLMTGSRGPVFLMILILPLYWLFGVAREGGVSTLGRFLLGLGLVLSVVNVVGADAVSAFRSRASGKEDVLARVLLPFTNPIRILPDVGVIGYGTGATHQMAEVLSPSLVPYSWLEGQHFEDEPSRIMVELGPIGFLAFFAVRVGLVVLAFGAVYRLKRPLPRALALSCLLLFLAQLTGGVVFNVTAGVYYWFFAGLLILAIRLDREAGQLARAASGEPSPTPRRTIQSLAIR